MIKSDRSSSIFDKRFSKWVQARTPRQKETILNQRRIYIVPSKAGLALVILFLLLILLGINFQNNLVYLVAFWLLALLVVNILYTYRNLSGLVIRSVHSEPCFAGERAEFVFEVVEQSGRFRSGIQLGWPQEDQVMVELHPYQTIQLRLTLPSQYRGWLEPERMTVISRYPTGLARAWSYVLPRIRATIYPKPLLMPTYTVNQANLSDEEQGKEIAMGSTDFSGVRNYQPGDSMKQIHWPQLAKTGQLASREFVDYQADDHWLDLGAITGSDLEAKLSHLSARIVELHQQSVSWGLRLSSLELPMNQGDQHKLRSLTALALFGLHDEN